MLNAHLYMGKQWGRGGLPFVHLHFHDNNVFKFVLITSYPDSQIWYTRKKTTEKPVES